MTNQDDEMLKWEKDFKRDHPIAMGIKWSAQAVTAVFVGFILAIPASLIVLGVHWLFTRWW